MTPPTDRNVASTDVDVDVDGSIHDHASTAGSEPTDAPPSRYETPATPWWAGYTAVAAASLVFVGVVLWGQSLANDGVAIYLPGPPFFGEWETLWSPGLWWALPLAVVLVAWWVPTTERLRWNLVLVGSGSWALLWSVVLQASESWTSLYEVLGHRTAYLGTARDIDSPVRFLDTYVERLPDLPTHVKGHPPGATLAHWLVDLVGGGRSDVLTATFLIIAASAAPAALIAMDRIAGREQARRAAPFVGLAPAVIWIATSPDAMFMGVLAWAVALGAIAITATGRRALVAGFASGLLAGLSLSFSYGSMLLLGPLWALAVLGVRRSRWHPLVPAAAGFAVVPVAFMAAGFNWFGGLRATQTAYLAGVAPERPDRYFIVANLAVLAVAIGPAAVAGLAWLRDRNAWWLVGGAAAGVIAADLSTMSKGEVERIWLPAVPFLVLATCAISGRTARRWWLSSQLGVAVALQLFLRSPW